MTSGTQHRLAAILAADIVGYSRLVAADEAGTLDAMRTLRAELWDPVTEAHGGRLVGTAGDSRLVEFSSTVAAVECAVAIQRAMVDRNADVPEDRRIRLRIGVNLGDVVVDGDDILGDGVNVAARLEAEAAPEGICVSDDVMRQVRGRLDLAFTDGGERELKNIPHPVRVWHWTPETAAGAATEAPLALPDKPSIAVLPFDNMSGDPEQEYFADGITEDIITALSKFRWLFVIARNSTFTYKGHAVSIADVARELGVRYVVEGSVRKAGARVRVTAQLIEAASGNHVWAERYDRDLTDIFELQDEITETITGAIEQEIGSVERTLAAHKRPENLEAWDLLQRGLHDLWQMDGENLEASVGFLRQSIARDPSFAEAHGHLAFARLHQVFLGFEDDADGAIADAKAHTHEAIKYDDRNSLGHEMLSRILGFEQRYDEAVMAAARAVEINPNSASANFALASICMYTERSAEALEPIDRTIRLSPKDPRRFIHLSAKGVMLGELGRLDEALELLRQATSMPHGDYRSAMYLARYAAEAGLTDEARRAAARVLELRPDFTLQLFETKLHLNFHPDLMRRTLHHLRGLGLPDV